MTPRPPVLARYFVPLLVAGALSLLLGGAIALGFAPAATAMVLGAREEAAAVLLCVGAAGTALGIYGASVVAPAYQARCAEACDQKAKAYLAAVRREDLSVSASFSRGEAVTKAPGVIAGGGAAPAAQQQGRPRYNERPGNQWASNRTDDFDGFTTSVFVAAATDSAALGYLAGGSLTGAAVGSALSASPSSSCDGEPFGGCDGGAGD